MSFNSVFNACMQVRPYFSIRGFSISQWKIQSHYETLDIPEDSNLDQVKTAFISKSKKYHPDKNYGDEEMHAKFVKLNEAYTVLSDPNLRSAYNFELMKKSRMYSSPLIQRSKDYKSPYRKNRDDSTDWSDFYSTYGGGKAYRDMKAESDSEFWTQYWENTKKFGGGEMQEGMSPPPKSTIGTELVVISGVLFAVYVWGMYILSGREPHNADSFNSEHEKWLLARQKK
uniref:dnaJ homolog subfamily C member 4-like n=1 Tax=Styela clava TaxID=7725 RepID=UPI00193A095F|nr:dnaJ homolog subfamily C member 4-like [Styela clava]